VLSSVVYRHALLTSPSCCASRRLQLNAAKTEIAWFGSRANLNKISGSDLCLPVGSNVIKPKEVVRDLGVYLDSELSFKQHITKVANSCFHHLRRLRQIRRSIDEDVMIQLVVAFVLSRIDYCNAVLAALPRSTIEPLQRVQNAAARLVFGLRSHDHITPALAQLHWLPVQFRIKFKLCLLMHQIHVGRCPAYLAELVSSSAENCRRSGLRSTSTSTSGYSKPRLRTKFAERAFSFSGPAEWNCLPNDLRMITDTNVFKKKLKAYFYKQAFCVA